MNWLFESGHAADLVLAVLAAEYAWLTGVKGRGAGETASLLLPAAMMMLALRAALTGSDWFWIALPLAAAFPVHMLDLAQRGSVARRTG
jgi:hypothetical protein